jgi:hypothetical protein
MTASAGLHGLWSGKWRVTTLHMDGLRIRIPSDGDNTEHNTAKLSHTTKGAKSDLLRVLDPFFKDGAGGSILLIKITGSRSNPYFGLELRKHSKPA